MRDVFYSKKARVNRGRNANTLKGVIIDTFNRADNALSLGQADTGQKWQTYGGTVGISGNLAVYNSIATNNAVNLINSGYSDGRVSIKCLPGNNDGVVFRATDADNHLRCSFNNTNQVRITKRVNGTVTNLITANYNFQNSDVITAVFIGSLIILQVNGVTFTSISETFNQYATFVGFSSAIATSQHDNFIFTPFTTLISDGFDRPDGAIGNADTGQVWQFIGNGSITVSGGKAVRATGTGVGIAYIDSGVADGSLITTFSGAADTAQIIRVKDISNYWMVRSSGVGGQYILTKSVNGALSNVVATGVPANGDLVQTVFVGNVYRVYVNGVLTINYTDTNNFLADKTYHGLRGGGTLTNVSWDNLSFASASVVAYDRFNRGDSPTLGKAETGQNYSIINGSASIVSGKAVPSASALAAMVETGLADFAVEVGLGAVQASGIAFRYSDINNGWYYREDNGTNTRVFKTVATVPTTPITTTGAATNDKLKLTADGPNIVVYRNGNYIGGIVDSYKQGQTQIGLYGANATATLDNFLASVLPSPNLYDSFNRADSTTTLGSADSGQAYIVSSAGTSVPVFGINGNQAYLASVTVSASGDCTAVADTGVSDCVVSLTLAAIQNSALFAGICFRQTDSTNFWVFVGNGTNTVLYKCVAGAFTSLGSVAGSAAGDVLTVIASGSTISAFRNGALIATVTDAFNSTATKHGIHVATANSNFQARLDNLKVRAL